jgi:hypothetical protein
LIHTSSPFTSIGEKRDSAQDKNFSKSTAMLHPIIYYDYKSHQR